MNCNGFEIERKFLIRMPDESVLRNGRMSEIVQVYLETEPGCTERVRARTYDSFTQYTHTVKRKVSNVRRAEDERVISRAEYELLLKRADRSRNPVRKKRYCFDSPDGVWELDVYPFWTDRAILELELTDENQRFSLPAFAELIREVTDDGRYTNKAISKAVPAEN